MGQKSNLSMLKKIHQNVKRQRLQLDIEEQMDDAIDEGDTERLLRLEFLRKRI